MDRLAALNAYHMSKIAYLLERLRDTPDGDGSLLDNSLLLYGSGMSNSNQHDHQPLPVLMAGGAGGRMRGGRHIEAAVETPLSNLQLGILKMLDLPVDSFGDSTAPLEIVA
jgi:hypothetical protein